MLLLLNYPFICTVISFHSDTCTGSFIFFKLIAIVWFDDSFIHSLNHPTIYLQDNVFLQTIFSKSVDSLIDIGLHLYSFRLVTICTVKKNVKTSSFKRRKKDGEGGGGGGKKGGKKLYPRYIVFVAHRSALFIYFPFLNVFLYQYLHYCLVLESLLIICFCRNFVLTLRNHF